MKNTRTVVNERQVTKKNITNGDFATAFFKLTL